MPRKKEDANCSFYHYVLEKDNEYKYFMTLRELEKVLGITRFTINNKLNNPDHKLRKHPDIKLTRCYIPVKQEIKRVLNVDELNSLREELLTV